MIWHCTYSVLYFYLNYSKIQIADDFNLFLGLDLKPAQSASGLMDLEERCGGTVSTTPSKERTRSQRRGLGKIMLRAITLTIRLLQLTQLINLLTASVQC